MRWEGQASGTVDLVSRGLPRAPACPRNLLFGALEAS